jgi:hypothetical protein
VSRSYCRRSGETRQRSSGGRTGAQATMASVNGRSAADADGSIEPSRRLIDENDLGVTAPEVFPDVLGHPRARPDRETSSLSHRIAPRGAISMAATPRPYSATSRSPCLLRSTPESSARFEMTCSMTSSVSTVSGSS